MPGVQAKAVAGVSAIATSATAINHDAAVRGRGIRGPERMLDTDPLPLTTHRLAEVIHLRANDVVDRLARAVDVLPDRVGYVVDRHGIGELPRSITRRPVPPRSLLPCPACAVAAAVGGPACSRSCVISGPSRSLEAGERCPFRAFSRSAENRSDWPAAAGPGAEDEGDDGPDGRPEKRSGQKIELLLALIVRIRLADGRAGAASPTRCRLQCICHPGHPPFRVLHEFRCGLPAAWKLW